MMLDLLFVILILTDFFSKFYFLKYNNLVKFSLPPFLIGIKVLFK